MSATLYRKYRPQQFSEVVGQKAVLAVLKNALKLGRVGHAYLLTGPRGTGKTTLARLFAKAVNCTTRAGAEPCGNCTHCRLFDEGRTLDVIEIDAASHTSVDNVRDLLETVKLPPSIGSHKVYIIDEVHMLSAAAFNALLKTLEEPPAHVIFFLATTELHKVPQTIISRCQRFDLSRLTLRDIVGKLEVIIQKEKLKADPEALVLIAESAEGGLRDAESLLTQVVSLTRGPITEALVLTILGATRKEQLYRLLEMLAARDLLSSLSHIRTLAEEGVDFAVFSAMLVRTVRDLLFLSASTHAPDLLDLSDEAKKRLVTIAGSFTSHELASLLDLLQTTAREAKKAILPELPLEIAVATFITPRQDSPPPPAPSPSAPNAPTPTSRSLPAKTPTTPAASLSAAAALNKIPTLSLARLQELWPDVLIAVRAKNPSFGLALSQCRPVAVDGNVAVLSTRYPIHGTRLKTDVGRLTVENAFATICGASLSFLIEIEPPESEDGLAETEHHPLVTQALTMLGGHIVG